jgi:hypothetical protein
MMNMGPLPFFTDGTKDSGNGINKMDINFTVETPEMIIGAVLINSAKSPEDTVVAKIFIYKYTTPYFIEVNFDESYINYLFDDPESASAGIANYALKMLTVDFPSSVLSMSSSTDIGMVQLPQSVNR